MVLLNTATKVYAGGSLASKVYAGAVQVWPPAAALAPVVVGSPVYAGYQGEASKAVTSALYPTPAVDDLIVAIAYQRSGQTGASVSVSSAGLTFTPIVTSPATFLGIGAWYAWSPDTSQRTVTATWAAAGSGSESSCIAVIVYVIRGVHRTTPIDVAGTQAQTASVSSYTIPAMTTNTANALAMFGGGSHAYNTPTTAASGWTWEGRNIGADGSFISGYRLIPAVGSTGTVPVTFTTAGAAVGNWCEFALASKGL